MSTETEEKSDEIKEAEDKRLPSLDVAKARIAQALIKYEVRVEKGIQPKEGDKVRL